MVTRKDLARYKVTRKFWKARIEELLMSTRWLLRGREDPCKKKTSCILVKQQKDMQLHNIKRCQVKCLFNVHCIINCKWLIIVHVQCIMTLSILKQKSICYEQCLSHIWSNVLIKWRKLWIFTKLSWHIMHILCSIILCIQKFYIFTCTST